MSYPPPPMSDWPAPRPAPDTNSRPLFTDANIQGNVLAGFNKDNQTLLLMSFNGLDVARAWLDYVLPRIATNAAVASFNDRFSARLHSSGSDPLDMAAVWTNVSLTAGGMRLLAPQTIADLEAHQGVEAGVTFWLNGAADPAALTAVGDTDINAPDEWLFGVTPVHALVCIAADRPDDLALEVIKHREYAAEHPGCNIVFEQPGATLPGTSAGHEHFGFRDGISQPGVRGFDQPDSTGTQVEGKPGTDLIAAGTFVLGYPQDQAAPVGVPFWMWDGSFLVTRRLQQDVPGFWGNVEAAHASLHPVAVVEDPASGIPTPDALAARLVGRWRSGTPTDHQPVVDNRSAQPPDQDNNFDFADDLLGDKTPACAHIRKVYPRSGAEDAQTPVNEEGTMTRRILRRGIPFGPIFNPTGGRGQGVDAERGLLFQCYQASLANQFVFLQQAWVNAPNFPNNGTGPDPIIGQSGDVTVRGGGQDCPVSMTQWVHTRGSLFSFTASLPVLRQLAAGVDPLPTSPPA